MDLFLADMQSQDAAGEEAAAKRKKWRQNLFERSAAAYLRMRKESYERAMAAAQARPIDLEEDEAQVLLACRARAEALARAKAEFGEELFLRLLYEIVATPMAVSYTGEDGTANHLRFVEGGCSYGAVMSAHANAYNLHEPVYDH